MVGAEGRNAWTRPSGWGWSCMPPSMLETTEGSWAVASPDWLPCTSFPSTVLSSVRQASAQATSRGRCLAPLKTVWRSLGFLCWGWPLDGPVLHLILTCPQSLCSGVCLFANGARGLRVSVAVLCGEVLLGTPSPSSPPIASHVLVTWPCLASLVPMAQHTQCSAFQLTFFPKFSRSDPKLLQVNRSLNWAAGQALGGFSPDSPQWTPPPLAQGLPPCPSPSYPAFPWPLKWSLQNALLLVNSAPCEHAWSRQASQGGVYLHMQWELCFAPTNSSEASSSTDAHPHIPRTMLSDTQILKVTLTFLSQAHGKHSTPLAPFPSNCCCHCRTNVGRACLADWPSPLPKAVWVPAAATQGDGGCSSPHPTVPWSHWAPRTQGTAAHSCCSLILPTLLLLPAMSESSDRTNPSFCRLLPHSFLDVLCRD